MVKEYLSLPLGFFGIVGMTTGTFLLWGSQKKGHSLSHPKARQASIRSIIVGAALAYLGWHIGQSLPTPPHVSYTKDRAILAQQILHNCQPELTNLYHQMLPKNSSLRALADVAKQSNQGLTCANLVPFPSDGQWASSQKQEITWGFTGQQGYLFVAMPIKFGSDRGNLAMWQIDADPNIEKFEHNFYDYINPKSVYDSSKFFRDFQTLGRGRVVKFADKHSQVQGYYRDRGFSICEQHLAGGLS